MKVAYAWMFLWHLAVMGSVALAAEQGEFMTVKACYAFYGFVNDLGFTYSQNLARAWVDAELGMQSYYIEGVGLSSTEDQVATLHSFVDVGCDIVVVGSETMESLMLQFADAYSSIKFICLTCCCFEGRPNVAAIEINNHEAAYISGVVAAMQEEVDTLAYVGSVYSPASFRNVNAFALGAVSVRPNITLLVSHVGSWYDTRTERIVSKQLILQHGVDLLAYDSDSTTVVQVAKELGKLSIAAKVDGTAVHGESNLMSRILLWTTPLLETMSAAVGMKNWTVHKDDNAVVGFAEQALSLGTFSSRVSLAARIKAVQLSQFFAAGEDPTWCLDNSQLGLPGFCPVDAINMESSPSCSLENGYTIPEDGNCLAWTQQREMAWFFAGYADLGLAVFPTECATGTQMDFIGTDLCEACQPGRVSLVVDAEECEPCARGRFAVDGLECRQCSAGTYSNVLGSSACADCPLGTAVSLDGQTQCTPCPEGSFTSTAGMQICVACPVGTYANQSGSSTCTACAEDKTTRYSAASTSSQCVCPGGSYRDSSGGCAGCPVGMVCSAGSDVGNLPDVTDKVCASTACVHPRTLPGYMSLQDAPLRVYKCLTEVACPGGKQGNVSSCGASRVADEVACGVCASGSYAYGDQCQECSGYTGTLEAIALLVGAVGALAVTSYIVNRDLLLQSHGMLSVIIICGVLLSAIQTTAVFSQLELDWVHPLKGLVAFASNTFTFNIRVLRIACHVPMSPVFRFCAGQLVAPCCVPVLALGAFIKRYAIKKCKVSMLADLVNSTGTIFSIFFMAVLLASIQPFVCYPHPGDTGSSMLSEPAVICWGDDERHAALVAIAVISFLLVPATFVCACLVATWMRSRIMVVNNDQQRWWLHAFRFIFFRFKAGKHFYGVFVLLRNVVICLIPAVIPGRLRVVQALLLVLVLHLSTLYQATLQPFATLLSNMADSCTSVVLIFILMLGMLRSGIEVANSDMFILSSVVCAVGLSALIGSACVGLRAAVFPTVRFNYFLSHHKAGAAAQARFLQMLIQRRLHKSCFLDSDNLVDLGVLFDIVKSSVAHFVLLLTRDTLRRPWCVGELVIATEAKLPITRILHPSFQKPTESDFMNVANYVPQQGSLVDFHIDGQRIVLALRLISGAGGMGGATITMDSKVVGCHGTFLFDNVVRELGNYGKAAAQRNRSKTKSNTNQAQSEEDAVVISTDAEDYEAIAVGGILNSSLQEKCSSRLVSGIVFLPNCQTDAHSSSTMATDRRSGYKDFAEEIDGKAAIRTARAVIVVLSSYTLQNLEQICVIDIASVHGRCSIPVCTPRFDFPSETYFATHLPALVGGDDGHKAVAAMKHFFEQIAITFSSHASLRVLEAEMDEVIARVPLRKVETLSYPCVASPVRRMLSRLGSKDSSCRTFASEEGGDVYAEVGPTGNVHNVQGLEQVSGENLSVLSQQELEDIDDFVSLYV